MSLFNGEPLTMEEARANIKRVDSALKGQSRTNRTVKRHPTAPSFAAIGEEFRQAMEKAGLTPPDEIIADGKLHRFASNGERGDDAGYYIMFSDGVPAGAFGCWRRGIKLTWSAKSNEQMNAEEQAAYAKRIAEGEHIRHEEEAKRHTAAAQRAQAIWASAGEAGSTQPYLKRKGVQAYGLRIDDMNRLIVPVMIDDAITSLQFISPDGDKRFLSGGKIQGGSFVIGDLREGKIMLIAEGFATAASVYEATNFPTVVAFSANNLKPVAEQLRQQFQQVSIVICGDNDATGTGQRAAHDAATAVGGLVLLPEKLGQDFNDLAQAKGLAAVRAAIETVLQPKEEKMSQEETAGGSSNTRSADTAQVHTPPPLAHDPNILARFEAAMRVCGVVGEGRCAKLTFLALTSRVLNEPVSLAIKGLSSSGKSFTTETTLKFFPDTAYIAMTAMSERALIYMKESFKHKTLVIFEAVALREQREKNESNLTAYFVRSLLSEGRISYPVTVRDKDHGFITKTITKEGPTNVILTTTATELHGENETRMLSIPTNDSSEQTKAIMRRLAQGKAQAVDFAPWHDFQKWLATAEHRVTIPYAAYLAEHIAPVAVRLRRDFRSILRLIEAHAILHQCTRTRDPDGRIVASRADYLAVRTLVADLIASGVGASVPETIRATVQAVCKADQGQGVTVKVASERLKLDRSAAQRRIQSARERGYLVNQEEKRGRPARYAIGETLPEEVELLPVDLPEGMQHSTPEAAASVHSVSGSDTESSGSPVQVCTNSGEKYSHEVEEVIDLVD